MIFVAVYLIVGVAFTAFVVDIGLAWVLKRHLQSSADAAALAGAQELSNGANATAVAFSFAAQRPLDPADKNQDPRCVPTPVTCPVGKNYALGFDDTLVRTKVELMNSNTKIRVTETADSPLLFGKIFSLLPGVTIDDIRVEATAVASKTSTVSGSPIAVYVHELCGNKGFSVNGEDATILGGIHSNGNYEIKNPGFEAGGSVTIYRAPNTGPPAQKAASLCKTQNGTGATYPAPTTGPAVSDYKPWVTPYHSPAIVKASAPCTHNPTGDVKFENQTLTPAQEGVYCLAAGKKFTLAGNVRGRITVLADLIEAGGTGKLNPYCVTDPGWTRPSTCVEETPILFYNTGGAPFPAGAEAPTTESKEIIVNPSGAYDWVGYIINRRGGIVVNAAGVTSPLRGLLEAEWITVNGEDFQMLGTAPDSSAGPTSGAVALEE